MKKLAISKEQKSAIKKELKLACKQNELIEKRMVTVHKISDKLSTLEIERLCHADNTTEFEQWFRGF